MTTVVVVMIEGNDNGAKGTREKELRQQQQNNRRPRHGPRACLGRFEAAAKLVTIMNTSPALLVAIALWATKCKQGGI